MKDAAVKERPILFSGAMVRAILENRKTQTRRVVKPQPKHNALRSSQDGRWYDADCVNPGIEIECPYGILGERLWVRETFRTLYDPATCLQGALDIDYQADGKERIGDQFGIMPWKPSIFMPRWASRITLEITGVRVERLRDISNEDAQAEGVEVSMDEHSANLFADLWDSINAKKHPWNSNPWVWVITFKVFNVSRT